MLTFRVYDGDRLATHYSLCNAYLLGSDNSAVRGTITFEDGKIVCVKREIGPVSLALQNLVGECGRLTVQTCLLPDRQEPYVLSIELARHRLMMLYNKFEDWAMFDLGDDHPAIRRFEIARRLFIEALCLEAENPLRADKLSKDSLVASIDGSEELALEHAERFLARRKSTQSLPKHPIGCGVELTHNDDRTRAALMNNFDFICLPAPWRELAPEEGDYRWDQLDHWAKWVAQHRMHVTLGPVVSFEPRHAPDWLFIWENDYETVRDLIYEHTQRIVTRYRNAVTAWNVVSGLHVNNHFTFTLEQLIDLTRMTTMLAKKIQPAARTLVEICQPFGEYYGSNARSVPPLMYADLIIQSAINFDGFVVKLLMGQPKPGQYARDLMQLSILLDYFLPCEKPVNVVFAVPSSTLDPAASPDPAKGKTDEITGGFWRRPWSSLVQSRWLEAAFLIALSKPYVESVAWNELIDHPDSELGLSGLITQQMQPKNALRRLIAFRQNLLGLGNGRRQPHAEPPTADGTTSAPATPQT